MENKLVSVIIPTFNRRNIINKSIDSVLNQTYKNIEILVIDDSSTDGTEEILLGLSRIDPRIKYHKNMRKKGVSGARNHGLDIALGEYVAFLDSDDEWKCNHLEESINIMKTENKKLSFCLWEERKVSGITEEYFGSDEDRRGLDVVVNETNSIKKGEYIVFKSPEIFTYSVTKFFYCNCISTMVMHRQIADCYRFNEKLFACEDIEYMLRIIYSYDYVLVLKYQHIYNSGEDNLHNFIDRDNITYEELMEDNILRKIIFGTENKCIKLKSMKKFVKKDNKLDKKDRKECIRLYHTGIGLKYYTLSELYRRKNYLKALNYSFLSMFYGYENRKFRNFICTLFIIKNHKIKIDDLWLT